jgi:hypothetical protein
MDDKTFDLLKRIDAGFDGGSGPYNRDINGAPSGGREAALMARGDEGFSLRMEIMKVVEAEKAARVNADYEALFSCPPLQVVGAA